MVSPAMSENMLASNKRSMGAGMLKHGSARDKEFSGTTSLGQIWRTQPGERTSDLIDHSGDEGANKFVGGAKYADVNGTTHVCVLRLNCGLPRWCIAG